MMIRRKGYMEKNKLIKDSKRMKIDKIIDNVLKP